MEPAAIPPDVSHYKRNADLYPTLRSMGLYVLPEYADEEQSYIESFYVSVSPPSHRLMDSSIVDNHRPSTD